MDECDPDTAAWDYPDAGWDELRRLFDLQVEAAAQSDRDFDWSDG